MKISAKGKYGLAAMIYLSSLFNSGEHIKLISISESLGISKIYLEQIFALLKKSGIVTSAKGSQGGYQLSSPPDQITAYDILASTETTLFDKNESSQEADISNIEKTLHSMVFSPLDSSIETILKEITLEKLLEETKNHNNENYIFYI